MIHLIPLIIAIFFLNYFLGYFYLALVNVLNLFDFRLSASGTLAITIQISFTLIATVINCLMIDIKKYTKKLKSLGSSNLTEFLIMVLVAIFWSYLIVTDYAQYSAFNLSTGLEALKSNVSLIFIITRWSVSVIFSFLFYFLLFSLINNFRRQSNDL
jgi:hypothetical protein